MIDGNFASWSENKNSNGVHMAGLKYLIDEQMKEYKTWMLQIPLEDGFNNITNKTAIWGIKKYPILKNLNF